MDALHHGHLLQVLFAKIGPGGLQLVEQDGDECCHAVEMAEAGCSLPAIGEALNLDERRKPVGIDR
jgi:hypothetical protein